MAVERDEALATIAQVLAEHGVDCPPSLGAMSPRELSADSFAWVEVLAAVERRFHVELPDEALETSRTVDELLDLVTGCSSQGRGGDAGPDRRSVGH